MLNKTFKLMPSFNNLEISGITDQGLYFRMIFLPCNHNKVPLLGVIMD